LNSSRMAEVSTLSRREANWSGMIVEGEETAW
jgi:hypothetical protein